ncbi:unnamed protein product [Gongylonema pulchrum]|uniref:t-SNARE coiled-coil homology domain-containing protein n=1 Tax=Gongylonema pulchrum TaxID=637853 RepID=A0A183EL57_9BILA|nr:unnamed protein product [Gongylonema pulchrum]
MQNEALVSEAESVGVKFTGMRRALDVSDRIIQKIKAIPQISQVVSVDLLTSMQELQSQISHCITEGQHDALTGGLSTEETQKMMEEMERLNHELIKAKTLLKSAQEQIAKAHLSGDLNEQIVREIRSINEVLKTAQQRIYHQKKIRIRMKSKRAHSTTVLKSNNNLAHCPLIINSLIAGITFLKYQHVDFHLITYCL